MLEQFDTKCIKRNSELIVQLAEQALENLSTPQLKHERKHMDDHGFRKEFGTVKISLPRQSGHTTAALQLLNDHPTSLCFVLRQEYKNEMLNLLYEYTSNPETHERIKSSIVVLTEGALLHVRPVEDRPFIIFDQTSMIRQDIYEHIKEAFVAGVIIELH